MSDLMLILHRKLQLEAIPVVGVSDDPRRVDYDPSATPAQRTLGDSIALGFNTIALSSHDLQVAAGQFVALQPIIPVTNFDYILWQDNKIIRTGSINDGIIEFSSDSAGVYALEIIINGQSGVAWVRVYG